MKTESKNLDKRVLITLVLATVYFFLYSQNTYNKSDSFAIYRYDFLKIGFIWALFLFISFNRYTLAIFLPCLFLIGAVCRYMIEKFNAVIDPLTIPLVFSTNIRETSETLTTPLVLQLMLALVLSIVGIYCIRKFVDPHRNDRPLLYLSATVASLSLFQGYAYTHDIVPYNALYSTGNYFIDTIINRQSIKYDIASEPAMLDSANNDLTVVLVLGESARGKNFGFNGYHRNTTPLLSKEPGLITFPHTIACEVLTRYSVPCIITRATSNDWQEKAQSETSFITIFKKLGFHTVWLNAQLGISMILDMNIIEHARMSHEYLTNIDFAYDKDTLPYIKEVIARNPEKLFLIVHTFGSHWKYDERYTEEFKKWSPTCDKIERTGILIDQVEDMHQCSLESLTNSYDNTILYTDDYLHNIITMLKDRNALMIYTSDHGESLGERGHYLHGQEKDRWIPEQRDVPLIFWASPRYIQKNPERYKALLQRKQEAVSHDNLFDSTLDCSGIDSQAMDTRLSLCRSGLKKTGK